MVALPQINDPTLEAADRAIVAAQPPRFRAYLGMSAIGGKCSRALWYGFRWTMRPQFDAATLKRFEDGHRTEDLVLARLKAVPEIELHDRDAGGQQFGFSDFGGHMRGHMDAVALGLPQAAKTWHVVEVKCSEKWTDLDKSKAKVGDKAALLDWNATYYGQAVLYMEHAEIDRHYLVAASPGGRRWTSVRTNADPAHAAMLRLKAERIIFSDKAPDRIGGPDAFDCRWCDFRALCHEAAPPERNCRTCLFAQVEQNGTWSCTANPEALATLTLAEQEAGCPRHRYLPALVPGEQFDVRGGDGNPSIAYRIGGSEWLDSGHEAWS